MSEFEVLDNVPEGRQIVGMMIDGFIDNTPEFVATGMRMIASGSKNVMMLTRWHMMFMSHADLGPQWDRMAKGPTYFGIDENGKPCFVKDGVWKPRLQQEVVG